MTSIEAALRDVLGHLSDAGVSCALIGGLAVSVRTEPRFTRDADLAVGVADDREAESLIRRLVASGYRVHAAVEQDTQARLATVRIASSDLPDAPIIDLLFASSGIEQEVVAAAEVLDVLPGLPMRVATYGHLIALKVLARDDITRPQDVMDLRGLLRVASSADLTGAREALALISARGRFRPSEETSYDRS